MAAALLLSGGIDSTALAYWKRPRLTYTVDYGQRCAASEMEAARLISKDIGSVHYKIDSNLSSLGAGLLIGHGKSPMSQNPEWWPYRNQMLITLAAMHAVQHNTACLMIGSIASDSRHADGTDAFVEAINKLMVLQEGNLTIEAPALQLSQLELVEKSEIPYSLLLRTHSCHTSNSHCCACPGCAKRIDLFRHLGLTS